MLSPTPSASKINLPALAVTQEEFSSAQLMAELGLSRMYSPRGAIRPIISCMSIGSLSVLSARALPPVVNRPSSTSESHHDTPPMALYGHSSVGSRTSTKRSPTVPPMPDSNGMVSAMRLSSTPATKAP